VRKELPKDAKRFQGIDKTVRAILKEAENKKNIVNACNKEGLYDDMEAQQALLDLCKKSLAEFLDGKRRQFPRFYFVSEVDLLDILSNGSRPRRIIHHGTKVFLSTATFTLNDEEDENERPTASDFIAGVGKERISLANPVKLEGKPEIYLQTVLDAMSNTLYLHLIDCLRVNQTPGQDRVEWLVRSRLHLYNIQCSEIFTLRYEKLHTEA